MSANYQENRQGPRSCPRIVFPEIPLTIYNESYSGWMEIEISGISDSYIAVDPKGWVEGYNLEYCVDVTFKLQIVDSTMDSDTHATIYYKVYDEEDMVAASGYVLCKSLGVGDKTTETERIFNLNGEHKYRLLIGGSRDDF